MLDMQQHASAITAFVPRENVTVTALWVKRLADETDIDELSPDSA